MAEKRTIHIVVDVAMAVAFVAVMATALVQEAPHEYLGVALFVLVVVHLVLNRRWFATLTRGRYSAVRVLQTASIAGLVACMAGLVARGLVLSKHAFGFLPALPGASWARRVHMLCSYWGFVLVFAHAGLQSYRIRNRLRQSLTCAPSPVALSTLRVALVLVACYGAYSFVRLNLPSYLLGQVQFAFVDYEAPLVLSFARYGSVAVLDTLAFYALRCLITRKRGAKDAARD